MTSHGIDRRQMLRLTLGAGAGLLALGSPLAAAAAEKKGKGTEKKDEVTANEDLMREHGVLIRLLLLSREAARRLKEGDAEAARVLRASTETIKTFSEGYHEKIEENYVFPKLLENTQVADLVIVLIAQHETGRSITGRILELTKGAMNAGQREETYKLVESFARMYYPHMAREDTVIFPAYRASLSRKEYDAMGERFEDEEHKMLGEGGYEKVLASVADLEKQLGIFDLAQFTPQM